MSSVQMLSPMVSALCLAVRAINIAKPTEHKHNFMVFINMWFSFLAMLTTFILILACYDYTDTRPKWAKQFEKI